MAFAVSAILLLLLPFSFAATINVNLPNTVTAVQSALNSPNSGDTVVVSAGTLDLGGTTLTINTAGVSLRGAGAGSTIFQSNVTGLQRLLNISASVADTPAVTAPTIIEGITFLNSAFNQSTVPQVNEGPAGAIVIRVSGPQGSQSIIRNCEFLDFYNNVQQPALDIGGSRWLVTGNKFDGLALSVQLQADANHITLTDNTFTRFWRGIIAELLPAVGNVYSGNTFANPVNYTPPYPYYDYLYVAIVITDGATSDGPGPKVTIKNNRMNGVTWGIVIGYGSDDSPDDSPTPLAGFVISDNSISGPFQDRNGPAAGVYMYRYRTAQTPLAVPSNWYGQASGPQHPTTFGGNLEPAPWITSFTDDPNKAGQPGFWPIDVCTIPLGTGVSPCLTPSSIDISPSGSLLTGSTFTLTAFSEAANVLGGTLTVVSTPPGITCQPSSLAGNSLQTTCTVAQAAAPGQYALQVTWVTAPQPELYSSTVGIAVQVIQCTYGECCNIDSKTFQPSAYVCRKSGNPCRLNTHCTGKTADCPSVVSLPDGESCPWKPRGRGCANAQQHEQASSGSVISSTNANLMASAAPQYQYTDKWPACTRLGICLEGVCALRLRHPDCCVVPCAYPQGDAEHAHPSNGTAVSAGTVKDIQAVSTAGSGYWRRAGLYCWT